MLARLSRLSLAALLLVLLTVATPIAHVHACSCMELAREEALTMADAAFVGVMLEVDDPNAGNPIISSGDPLAYTFAVEEVLKGNLAGPTAQVSSARDGATCGMQFAQGQRWRLYAYASNAGLETGICSGNELLAENVPLPDVAPTTEEGGGGTAEIPAGVLLALGGFAIVAVVSVVAFGRVERKAPAS